MWPKKSTENDLLQDHNYCLRPGNYKINRDEINSSEDDSADFKSEQSLHDSHWMSRVDLLGNEYEVNGINQPLDPCPSKAELLTTAPKAFGLNREVKSRPTVCVKLKKEENTKPKGNLIDEYKCSTCLYITGNRNNFRMHLSKHRLVNLKINECDVVLTKDNDFQCKKCHFKTSFIHRFKYHLKQHETEEALIENKGNDDINSRTCYKASLKSPKNDNSPSKNSESPKSVNTLVEKSSLTITEVGTADDQKRFVTKTTTKPKQNKSKHKNHLLESDCPEYVKRFAKKTSKLLMTEVSSIDKQHLLGKEESTETKESNQMIEMYVLDFDSTENVDPLTETTFNLERSDLSKRTANSDCCDLVNKYKKYLDMSQYVQINEIENSAERNESIAKDIQEECKIVPVKISELFSKKVEDFGCLEPRFLDNQNVLISQDTLEPKEANCVQITSCSSEASNLEPGDQSEIHLQDSNEPKSDSNKFKCDLCDFVSNYKKYLRLHMSRHEKPVKLRWHKERKKRVVKVGWRRRRRPKVSGPIDMNKSYTGFKCYEKNCHFIANIKEYLDLHLEKHLKLAESSTVISKLTPNLVLQEQQQNTDPVYETLKGFKCNNCHFITNSKEYMELHIKEHQPSPELERSENANVENLNNPPTCTTYSKDQPNILSNDVVVFSHDTSSDVSKRYRAYRCKRCDFSTHFIKFFKAHLDKHTTKALQQHVDVVSDNIPRGLNNQPICNEVTEKRDRKVPVSNLADKLDFPERETYNKICEIMDSEDCDIDHNQSINDNGNEKISEFSQRNSYRCEICDFSTHFREYLDLHLQKHACDIDKQSNFHPTDNFNNEINELFLKKEINMWEKLDPYLLNTWEEVGGQDQYFSTIPEYWLNLEENNLESVPVKEGSKTQTFQCEYCNYTTKFEKNMTIHENYHILNRAYKCNKCRFSTNFTKFFEAHLESHIANERSTVDDFSNSEIPGNINKPRAYKCKKCDFSTNFTRFFEAHLESHIPNEPERPNANGSYQSEIPGNISKTDRPYKCKNCNFSTHFTSLFEAHLETHIPNRLKNLDMDCFYEVHIPTIQDRAYKCKKCDFSTHFIRFLEAHIEKHYIQEYTMDPLGIDEEIL